MFGLSGYLWIALAVSLAATAAAGWFALHEYGVAAAQASRDRAQIAQVQAQETAKALAEQQAIDWLRQLHATSSAQASTANQSVRTIIRTEPATACARQPIPQAILRQINATP